MKKEISIFQFCVLIIVSILSLKVLTLPSFIYITAGCDGFISIFFIFIFELMVILIFFYLKNKHKNKSFSEICEASFGKIITKLILFCVFLLVFVKFNMLLWESYTYLRETIFKNAPLYLYMVVLISTTVSLVLFGLNSFARTAEFFIYIIVLCFIIIIIVSLASGSLSNVLPFFKEGLFPFFHGAFDHVSWFGDTFLLFLFIDKIKFVEKSKKKALISFFIVAGFLVLFYACFYGIYTVTSPNHRNAITDIVRFAKRNSTVDTLDWIPIFTIMFIVVIQSSYYFFCMKHTYEQGFKDLNVRRFLVLIVLLICVVNLITTNNIQVFYNLYVDFLKYPSMVIFYLLPILLFLINFFKSKKRRLNYEKSVA